MYSLEKITLYKYEFEEIQNRLSKLNALEQGGVENWEYYDHAIRHWKYQKDLDDLINKMIDDLNDVMTEAEVDEPAGHGAGYRIDFDETQVKSFLREFASNFVRIENARPKD